MKLIALPAFTDNYIWMMHDGRQALVVDPGDAAPVRAAMAAEGLELVAILVTHHHPDHVGGIHALREVLRGPVIGPARERIPEPFQAQCDGDVVSVMGVRFEVLDVPGHTAGHIAYVHRPTDGQAPILFCGDTLFSGGCGRLFEGTAAQMHASLTRLAELPGPTRVCCAHEYTESNLKFAQAVEPGNADLARYAAHCRDRRAQGLPTLPSSVALELQINPFMRCMQASVVTAARQRGATNDSGAAVLAALREWKNGFQ